MFRSWIHATSFVNRSKLMASHGLMTRITERCMQRHVPAPGSLQANHRNHSIRLRQGVLVSVVIRKLVHTSMPSTSAQSCIRRQAPAGGNEPWSHPCLRCDPTGAREAGMGSWGLFGFGAEDLLFVTRNLSAKTGNRCWPKTRYTYSPKIPKRT